MRLDKWLKVSRLIKRRTVANEACDNERVSVNGRVRHAVTLVTNKTAHRHVLTDNEDLLLQCRRHRFHVLEIRFGAKMLRVEVVSVQDNVGKADAAAMYRELPQQE